MMMRTKTWMWMAGVVVGVGTFACSALVRAEGGLTLEERVERLERRGEMPPPAAPAPPSGLLDRIEALERHVKNLPFGLRIGGMVVTSYMYNFNQPDTDEVQLRAFDRDDNTFSFDLFQLEVSRAPGDEGVGFVTKLDFGKTARWIASDWDGDGTIGNVSEEENDFELEEAYVTYNFPGLPELGLKAGKFVTLLGSEVVESPRNYNVSRSLAYSWAIPIEHTGVLASYAFTPEVSLTMGVVNGWNNVIDSNDGKSFLGSLSVVPCSYFSAALNGVYGPEQPDNSDVQLGPAGGSKRGVLDLVVTAKPIEDLVFSLNYDYGSESNLDRGDDPVIVSGDKAEWNAVSAIAAYELREVLPVPIGFAVRGEYFDDSDGTRLTQGTSDVPPGHYQNAWEVTGTFKVVMAKGLEFRTEYRYDSSQNDLFDYKRGIANTDDQHTIAGELSYVF